MSKKNPGVSVTAVINPLDRLKLAVLVRDEILTQGENSSVSSMVNTFLGIMLSSPLMQKKIQACAEKQAAQDSKLGRTETAAQKVLGAYRGAPPVSSAPTPQPSQPTQPAQPEPEPEPAELAEQPVFDLASLNPGLRVASKVRPAGYPGSEKPLESLEPTPAQADAGDSKPARGLLGNLLGE